MIGQDFDAASQDFDEAKAWRVIAQSVSEEGFGPVTAADVEAAQRTLRAGRPPTGVIGQAIARHLRLLEDGGG